MVFQLMGTYTYVEFIIHIFEQVNNKLSKGQNQTASLWAENGKKCNR